MTMVRSRYLLLGETLYRAPDGRRVRLGYATRTARLLILDTDAAEMLAAERSPASGPSGLSGLSGPSGLSGLSSLSGLSDEQADMLASHRALVPETEDELAAVLADLRAGSMDPGTRSFAFMPTSDCTMGCDYCGQEHTRSNADRSAADRFAARVQAAIADPRTRSVTVSWFGGEPLLGLRTIRRLSAQFTAAADEAATEYSATMPTNGSLLTERTLRVLHDECRLTRMDVTLDGPETVHDRRRVKRHGPGAFHRTVAALAQAISAGTIPRMELAIRVNVDTGNAEHVNDLIIDLACFGLASPQVELQLMPVHAWGRDESGSALDARDFARREIEWLRLAQELGLRFRGMPGSVKRGTCRATSRMADLTDASGNVYACSEHPLVPGVRETGMVARIADLAGADPRPPGMFDDWYDTLGDAKQPCHACPLLPVCAGACPKQWHDGAVPCPSLKHNWRQRMDLAAPRLGLRPIESR